MQTELELIPVSKPFPSTHPHPNPANSTSSVDKFPSALFLNFTQAIASCLSAITYLIIGSWRDGSLGSKGLRGVLGIDQLRTRTGTQDTKQGLKGQEEVKSNGNGIEHNGLNGTSTSTSTKMEPMPTKTDTPLRQTLPFLLLQVSAFQTMAGPIGFSALRHISYPTMVLGKVCHVPLT